MINLKNFKSFLIVEKIEADKITVYHRTEYNKPEDFKLGFKVGGGAYHGAGLYSTQEIKDQMDGSMINTYGPIIVEFDVVNSGKFLYFDLDLAKKIMSGKSLERQRDKLIKKFDVKNKDGGVIVNFSDYSKYQINHPDFKLKELDDELSKLKISKEDYKPYGLISQLKKILGGKFNKIYHCSKDELNRLDNELYEKQSGERNAGIANQVVRLPGILSNIDGMVYTGFIDGNCVLIYDPNLATATRWAIVPDKETYDKGVSWNLIGKTLNNDLEKSHIFNNEKSGILFNQGVVGNKIEIQNTKSSKKLVTTIIGKIPDDENWRDFNLGITKDISKKLSSDEGDNLLVKWRGLKNKQDKILNQMIFSQEFLSGLNLMDILKEKKGEKYEKLSNIFKSSPDIIISNLKLDLFGKNADSNKIIIKEFIKNEISRVTEGLLEFLLEQKEFDILKNNLQKLDMEFINISRIFFDENDKIYQIIHKNFTKEEIENLLIKTLDNISLYKIIDLGLLNNSSMVKQIIDNIFKKEGKPLMNILGKCGEDENFKKILDILIKSSNQENVFEILKKTNLIYQETIFNLVFSENKESIFNEKILIEYLKLIRDHFSENIYSSIEDYIVKSNNPIVKKYKKSILKEKYNVFFDNFTNIESNYRVGDFIEVFYNNSDTIDIIKKWFSTGKIKIKKEYSYENFLIKVIFTTLEKISSKKDSEIFIKNLLDFLFNIKELRLNFLAKDPDGLFDLVKEKNLVKNYKQVSEDLSERRDKLREARNKRENQLRTKNYEESEARKNEILEILNGSETWSELLRILQEKRLLLGDYETSRDYYFKELVNEYPDTSLYTRSIGETELNKFNSTIGSLNKELRIYISEGKLQSKFKNAKTIKDIVELYGKELSSIKNILNSFNYKFKNFIHKII
jgi:hypothetical protein